MHWKSRKGKSRLIHMLMAEHGLSKRKAEQAVNVVFDAMKQALRRGEAVDVPVGTIWVDLRPPNRQPRQWKRFRNIQNGQLFYRLVDYPQKEIHFRPDPKLMEPPPKKRPKSSTKARRKSSKPPAKTTPQLPPTPPLDPAEELVALYQQLVGSDLSVQDLNLLLAVSQKNTNLLLERLRSLAAAGRVYQTPQHLIAAVARLGPRN